MVLKVDSPDILHKTEAGVVRLTCATLYRCERPTRRSLASAAAYAPQARITGVSVQEMVGDGIEVIIEVSCDPQLGPVLLFGSGGVMVEVYNDVALRRCPITRREAQAMIAEVKGAQLLQGFRGRPAADLDALADILVLTSPSILRGSWRSWTSIRSWCCHRSGREGSGCTRSVAAYSCGHE
jgi:acetate---CoA ligase (ADP-forming)